MFGMISSEFNIEDEIIQTMAQPKVRGEGVQMALKWIAVRFSFAKVAKIFAHPVTMH